MSRSADAMVNLLHWARTGQKTPLYPSAEARGKDIEAGASRPLSEQLEDMRTSAARFELAAESLPPSAWQNPVPLMSGKVIAAAEVPWRRLVEVLMHHVDLGTGYRFCDLPETFVTRELAFLLGGFRDHEGVPAVRLRGSDTGAHWELGEGRPRFTVSGPGHALLAWVSGRSAGGDLATEPGWHLPALPPLG